MRRWLTPGEALLPPYKGHKNKGNQLTCSTSTLNSVTSETGDTGPIRPSKFYNNSALEKQRVRERENNLRDIEIANRKIAVTSKTKAKEQKGLFGGYNTGTHKMSLRGNSKEEAIRSWEMRQEKRKSEKGLFATMDEKGYGYNHNCFERWARENPKEIIKTIYIPISTSRKGNKRPESRTSTNLPPYSKEGNNYSDGKGQKEYQRIYPRCPSPYKDNGEEYSVDRPTYHQIISSSARTSPAMGTIFEGCDGEDSYMDSDEINLAPSHSEYDGDWDSTDENENSEVCTDEAVEAMRLTRPFNLGAPFGRRCPKVESTVTKKTRKEEYS